MGPLSILPAAVLALLAPLQAAGPVADVDQEPGALEPALVHLNLLDNGDFEAAPERLSSGGPAVERIPWWKPVLVAPPEGSEAGAWAWDRAERGWDVLASRIEQLPLAADGRLQLPGDPRLHLVQPVAAHGPSVGALQVRGRVEGAGVLVLLDGRGRAWRHPVGTAGQPAEAFTWEPALGLQPADQPAPRLTFGLAAAGSTPVTFDDLELRVPLPLTLDAGAPGTRAGLAAEVEALLVATLDQLSEGGRDRFGPRESAFWVGLHDVDTGAFLGGGRGGDGRPSPRVGLSPLNAVYLEAVALGVGGERFRTRFADLTAEFLSSCLHPETGLPRRYDPLADAPVDGESIEVAAYLGHLVDLANGGVEPGHGEPGRADLLPAELHAAAFEAALGLGQRLLDQAVLPDGNVAALVRPADGQISTSVVHLRRLDVPAQLVRLAALLRDRGREPELQQRLVDVAREAVLEVEFANLWPGTWSTIDPGFDDTYGHLGERSIAMAAAWPEEPAFARLARTGRAHFAPLWRQALAHGGNVAADQVRCWRILAELAELDEREGRAPYTTGGLDTAALLQLAARNHFKGEQTTTGAWLDVTIVGHDPATNLPVGDVIGLPQNLLEGLAVALAAQAPGSPAAVELRALYATVLGSTVAAYGAPFGFAGGDRSSSGSARVLGGLASMLAELRRVD